MAKKKKYRVSEHSIHEYTFDEDNPRKRDAKARSALEQSLRHFGAVRSLGATKGRVIRAGNGTARAALAGEITEVIEVETDGSQLVVVYRPDLDGSKAALYREADNRASDLATYDYERLAEELRRRAEEAGTTEAIEAVGWEPHELAPLLGAWTPQGKTSEEFVAQSPRHSRYFVVTMEQYEVVMRAVEAMRRVESDASISPGRAMELISADYLSGVQIEEGGASE